MDDRKLPQRRPSLDSASSSDIEMTPESSRRPSPERSPSPVRPVSLPGVNTYMHFTNPAYMNSIHEKGLIGGESEGIGAPGKPEQRFREEIFVADADGAKWPSAEAGGGNVAVVSRRKPVADTNYGSRGGAYSFTTGSPTSTSPARIRPLREFPAAGSEEPYAFNRDRSMTPRTRAGAHRYARQFGELDNPADNAPEISEEEAVQALEGRYRTEYPLHGPGPAALLNSPRLARTVRLSRPIAGGQQSTQ